MAQTENIIDLGYDMDKLSNQQKLVVEYLLQTINLADQLDRRKIAPDISGQQGLNEAFSRQKDVIDALSKSHAKYITDIDSMRKQLEQLTAAKKKGTDEDAKAAKAASDALKAKQAEQKLNADLINDYKQLQLAYRDAAERAINYQLTLGKTNPIAVQATKDARDMKKTLDEARESVGNYTGNVGNYSSALTGYANVLRGLRDPTKLLGEALGIGAQSADQLRLVIEHSIQGLAAYFRAKESKTAATAADTVATQANTAVTTENVVATQASAVADIELASAGEALAASESEVAAATGTLMTIMSGGLYLAIGAVVAVLAVAIGVFYNWSQETKEAAKAAGELADQNKKIIDGITAEVEFLKNSQKEKRKILEEELANAEASGASQEKLFAIKKRIAAFDIENSINNVNHVKVTEKTLEQAKAAHEAALIEQTDLAKRLKLAQQLKDANSISNEARGIYFAHENVDDLEALKSANEKKVATTGAALKLQEELFDDFDKSRGASQKVQLEEAKFNSQELRKIALEEATQKSEMNEFYNSRILSDEKSTLNQRLMAIKSNGESQKQLLIAQNLDIQHSEGISRADKEISEKKTASAIEKVRIQSADNIKKIVEEYAKRDIMAKDAELNSLIARQQAHNQQILQDEMETFGAKLDAHNKNAELEITKENEKYSIEKNKKGLTDLEIQSMERQHQDRLSIIETKATIDRLKFISELRAKEINRGYQEEELASASNYRRELERALFNFETNKIKSEEFAKEKARIDRNYADQALDSQIVHLEKLLKNEKVGSEKYLQYQEQISKIQTQKDQNRATEALKNDTEKQARKKELAQKEKELAFETLDLIKTAVDARYENELNQLQRLKDASDQNYANNLKNIQASTLSEQDKAAKTVQLQAEQLANQKKFEKEQRDIKSRQAKADRIFQLFQIAGNTAIGITKTIAEFGMPLAAPLVAIVAALGAVQLAKVLATPIPQYAEGTDDHPGGLAIVGEGKFKELVTKPSGESFIADKAMLLDLPAGTTVQPLSQDDINQVMYGVMIRKTSEMIAKQDIRERMKQSKSDADTREQLSLLRKIAAKETRVRTTNEITIDLGYTEYINKQVFGR